MSDNRDFLGTEPIGSLLRRLALPTVAAQIINMLYNIVDRIYIGHIPGDGVLALTGVGVCMPLIMVVTAFAAFAASGGAPRASIFMGKGDKESAEKTLGNCLMLQIIISIILTVVLLVYSRPVLLLFGASENTIGYATSYMSLYALGTVFVQVTLGMNAFITAQGFAKEGMFSVLIGAIANILLDPVFIFVFGLGIRGAAIATVLSQILSAAFVLYFLRKKTELKVRLLSGDEIRDCWNRAKNIISLGTAGFIMQLTNSLVTICCNNVLSVTGGDLYISVMTIVSSIRQIIDTPIHAITEGSSPVISYN